MIINTQQQEENGRLLRERLKKTVEAGPKSGGLFDIMRYNFSKNLLNDLTKKVK